MSPPDKAFPPSHFPARGGLPSRHDVRVPCFAPQETAAGVSAPSKNAYEQLYILHTGTGDWNSLEDFEAPNPVQDAPPDKALSPSHFPARGTHAPSSGTADRNGTHTKHHTDRRRTASGRRNLSGTIPRRGPCVPEKRKSAVRNRTADSLRCAYDDLTPPRYARTQSGRPDGLHR